MANHPHTLSNIVDRDPNVNDLPDRIITWPELHQIVRYSRVHVGRLEKAGLFPRRLRLGPGRVGWLLSEIRAWLDAKKAERDADAGSPLDTPKDAAVENSVGAPVDDRAPMDSALLSQVKETGPPRKPQIQKPQESQKPLAIDPKQASANFCTSNSSNCEAGPPTASNPPDERNG